MKIKELMKFLFLAQIVGAQEADFLEKQKLDFRIWLHSNKHSFASTYDYEYRLSVFVENLKEVERHNNSNSSFKKGLNCFAHLTDDEFMSIYASNVDSKGFGKKSVTPFSCRPVAFTDRASNSRRVLSSRPRMSRVLRM